MPENDFQFRRRDFLRWSASMMGGLIVAPFLQACASNGLNNGTETPTFQPLPTKIISSTLPPMATVTPRTLPTTTKEGARIAFIHTRDRLEGVQRAITLLGENSVSGKSILLKPNFNSSDPAPASSHPDTLRSLVKSLQEMGTRAITVADRSGMGNTRQVMDRLGMYDLSEELGFDTLVFDDLTNSKDWVLIKNDGHHWENGFPVPRKLLEAEAIVQTCCLKPHRFGGHFTMSLKNSVGFAGKYMGRGGHNYMSELHNSPYQRLMIAEINTAYEPALVVLDGVEAFIDNGPDQGTRVWGEVILAGTDRVAIDVVGLALLRFLGYTGIAADGPIFAQEQIARAIELGLGIDEPDKISFITDDPNSATYAAQIQELIMLSG